MLQQCFKLPNVLTRNPAVQTERPLRVRQPVGGLRFCNLLRAAVGRKPDGRRFACKRCKFVCQALVLLLTGGKLFIRQADVFCRRACYAVEAGLCEAGFTQRRRCGIIRAFVDDHQQIQTLLVSADHFNLLLACGFVNSLAQRVKPCLRRDGADQHARVLRSV